MSEPPNSGSTGSGSGTRGLAFDIEGDFETWARFAAKLFKRSDAEKEQILTQFRLLDRWPGAERAWERRIDDAMAEGDTTWAQRYATVCGEELRRRAKDEQHEAPPPPHEGLPTPPPAGDFRAEVMRPASERGPESAPPNAPARSLAEQMQADVAVPAPAAGQEVTAPATVKPKQALATLSWEVERYAEVCHAVSRCAGPPELVLSEHGIGTIETFKLAQKLWGERLVKDQALADRFARKMSELTEGKAPASN